MIADLSTIFAATRAPLLTWEKVREDFFVVLRGFAVVTLACTALYFVTTLPNLEKLRLAAASLSAKSGMTGAGSNLLPWSRLFLFPVWTAGVFLAAVMRFLTVRFLGDGATAGLAPISSIGMIGIAPLLVANTIVACAANFAPMSDLRASHPLTVLSLLCVLMGLILEARITIPMFRAQFSQTTGRAILTWISPYVLGMCFCSLPVAFFALSMLKGPG